VISLKILLNRDVDPRVAFFVTHTTENLLFSDARGGFSFKEHKYLVSKTDSAETCESLVLPRHRLLSNIVICSIYTLDSMLLTGEKAIVVRDLLEALQDTSLADVYLTASDQTQVPACRFVLAARSQVLKKMLYGAWREAKSSTICMMGYETQILQAIVTYCSTNTVVETPHDNEEGRVRWLVELSKAADYLQLTDMRQQVDQTVGGIMVRQPPLACAVLDEADPSSSLASDAIRIIEGRPYEALETNSFGGIESIMRREALVKIMSGSIAAGEYFLFRMLRQWFDHQTGSDLALEAALDCSRYLKLENIEPQVLLEEVQACSFVLPERIFEAVAKQALRASQQGAWNLGCRGRESVDRILVENSGVKSANGLYYQIAGLSNGGLYSKREVACGQDLVHTLSCSVKDATFEGRLFSSKLLTCRAVTSLQAMQKMTAIDPVFQPVLQVVSVEPPESWMPSEIRKYYRVKLSDGEFHMNGTLSSSVLPLYENQDIAAYSVIQILEFGLYEMEGNAGIHIMKASVVRNNPGLLFGNPVSLDKNHSESPATMSSAGGTNGLQTLYSCKCPAKFKDIMVPHTGWQVEDHGASPGPTCLWIPATPSSTTITNLEVVQSSHATGSS
jgi:hypothetical protein